MRKKEEEWIKKRHKETFGDAAFVYYLDCGYILTDVYVCKKLYI